MKMSNEFAIIVVAVDLWRVYAYFSFSLLMLLVLCIFRTLVFVYTIHKWTSATVFGLCIRNRIDFHCMFLVYSPKQQTINVWITHDNAHRATDRDKTNVRANVKDKDIVTRRTHSNAMCVRLYMKGRNAFHNINML